LPKKARDIATQLARRLAACHLQRGIMFGTFIRAHGRQFGCAVHAACGADARRQLPTADVAGKGPGRIVPACNGDSYAPLGRPRTLQMKKSAGAE
jgi:hypothetical protein